MNEQEFEEVSEVTTAWFENKTVIKVTEFLLRHIIPLAIFIVTLVIGVKSTDIYDIPFFQITGSILTPIFITVSMFLSFLVSFISGNFELTQSLMDLIPVGYHNFHLIIGVLPVTIIISRLFYRAIVNLELETKSKFVICLIFVLVVVIGLNYLNEIIKTSGFSDSNAYTYMFILAGIVCWATGKGRKDFSTEDICKHIGDHPGTYQNGNDTAGETDADIIGNEAQYKGKSQNTMFEDDVS